MERRNFLKNMLGAVAALAIPVPFIVPTAKAAPLSGLAIGNVGQVLAYDGARMNWINATEAELLQMYGKSDPANKWFETRNNLDEEYAEHGIGIMEQLKNDGNFIHYKVEDINGLI